MSQLVKIECPFCKLNPHGINEPDRELEMMWHFVPEIICINLKDRHDRRKHAMFEFHRVGLCRRVKFLLTDRPLLNDIISDNDSKQRGTMGCWKSHSEASSIIMNYKVEFGLIFEDDVLFDENIDKIKQSLISIWEFLEKGNKWDIIYLGYWSFWIKPTNLLNLSNKPMIQKCHARCFHAYMIHNSFARKLSQETWEIQQQEKPALFKNFPTFGIDSWTAYKSKHTFCLLPMIATQAPIISSNDRAINKKMIDVALSNPRFMKMNQYISLIGGVFMHSFLWLLSLNYRRSVTT